MPDAGPDTGPVDQAERLDALRSRSQRAWQDAQSAWARAQAIQARQDEAVKASAREPGTVSRSARLEALLASLPVIEQAKGMLMARQGCDADQALDLLCQAAQRSNMPVREVAEQIVTKAQRRRAST